MTNLNKTSLFILAVVLTLVVILCVDAKKVREEDVRVINDHVDDESNPKILYKRAAEDVDDEKPRLKTKTKKKHASTPSPSGSNSTTTKAGSTTTEHPVNHQSSTTENPDDKNSSSTTKEPKSEKPEDVDDAMITKIIKDQSEEKNHLEKAYQAIRDWVGWMETHDKSSLNRNKAQQLLTYVTQLVPRYLYRKDYYKRPRDSHTNIYDVNPKGVYHKNRWEFTRLR